ncbi:phage tail protein [Marinomonas posidonica]|uniref:phage tail protein n=1 Tax=Marinomonas posidonica TaxID=936476 RepID=UPI00373653C8
MSDFRTYITQTGFGLERDAKFNNTHVDLSVLVVGDGVLADNASPTAQEDLIHQVREYAITIEKDELDPNVWIARAEIPASDGGFFIKEAGIKTQDGSLYAYARQAGDYKPLLEEGQGKSYTIRLKFVPGNADAIQIKIDPSVQFATPTDLEKTVKAHLDVEDPHPQYQTKALATEQAVKEKEYVDAAVAEKKLFTVAGTANELVLTSPEGVKPISKIKDYDEFTFVVSETNTDQVSIVIDQLGAIPLSGVTAANQLFKSALLTVRYIAGEFYVVEQVNPKTGNNVLDIAKLYMDTVDALSLGEYALDGSTISSNDHPIACAKAAASSNYIEQASKDADPITYGGYYGFVEEEDDSVTVSLPIVGGEFIRMFDDGRGVDTDRVFGSMQKGTVMSYNERWDGTMHSAESDTAVQGNSQAYLDAFGMDRANPQDYLSIRGLAMSGASSNKDFLTNTSWGGGVARPHNIAYYGKTRL